MDCPFLTQKERDVETGLDYFLARYYSSTQGRFTSPDEFTGGPNELYYFADDAAANPTFYAHLRKPQSLNKYQYAFNNPLRYVDPDGHDADEAEPAPDPPQGQDAKRIPVPRGPGPTPAEAQQTYEVLKKIWELPDPYLYPISQAIGTAPDPTIPAVPIGPIANRVIRDGKKYLDTQNGNIVYVGKKGHTVITDSTGRLSSHEIPTPRNKSKRE